jgi:hypothetical protein
VWSFISPHELQQIAGKAHAAILAKNPRPGYPTPTEFDQGSHPSGAILLRVAAMTILCAVK